MHVQHIFGSNQYRWEYGQSKRDDDRNGTRSFFMEFLIGLYQLTCLKTNWCVISCSKMASMAFVLIVVI